MSATSVWARCDSTLFCLAVYKRHDHHVLEDRASTPHGGYRQHLNTLARRWCCRPRLMRSLQPHSRDHLLPVSWTVTSPRPPCQCESDAPLLGPQPVFSGGRVRAILSLPPHVPGLTVQSRASVVTALHQSGCIETWENLGLGDALKSPWGSHQMESWPHWVHLRRRKLRLEAHVLLLLCDAHWARRSTECHVEIPGGAQVGLAHTSHDE